MSSEPRTDAAAEVKVKNKTEQYLRSKNLKADWERILRKADRERPAHGQPLQKP